ERAQSRRPFPALVAVEWTGMTVAALALGPQTNTRHLVLGLVPTALAAVLLLSANDVGQFARSRRAAAAVVLLLILIGLNFPPKIEESTSLTAVATAWLKSGGPCWCLVLAYAVLLPASLRKIAAILEIPGPARPIQSDSLIVDASC